MLTTYTVRVALLHPLLLFLLLVLLGLTGLLAFIVLAGYGFWVALALTRKRFRN